MCSAIAVTMYFSCVVGCSDCVFYLFTWSVVTMYSNVYWGCSDYCILDVNWGCSDCVFFSFTSSSMLYFK